MRLRIVLPLFAVLASRVMAADLEPVAYNHPGLTVDLGVGLWAWPLPMDFDEDGDLDLLVSCPDKPTAATLFFENPGGGKHPVFRPGVRVGPALPNIQASYPDGKVRLLVPGRELVDFKNNQMTKFADIYPKPNVHEASGRIRANQWKYADYDDDGRLDLIVGVGDWSDYGWDDAFDAEGNWTHGPLHGHVYLIRNTGTTCEPRLRGPDQDRGRWPAHRRLRHAIAQPRGFRRRWRSRHPLRRVSRRFHLFRERRKPGRATPCGRSAPDS